MISRGHIKLNDQALIDKCNYFIEKLDTQPAPDGTITTHQYAVVRDIKNMAANKFGVTEAHLAKAAEFVQPHLWEEFQDFISLIQQETNNTVKQSWFNIMPDNASREAHAHRLASHSVFVYYPQITENNTQIELLIDDAWVPIICNSGDWIQFSNACLHRIPANKAGTRISFAFNV